MSTASGRAKYNRAIAKYDRSDFTKEKKELEFLEGGGTNIWSGSQVGSKFHQARINQLRAKIGPSAGSVAKRDLAIQSPEDKFKQKYPNLGYNDPNTWIRTPNPEIGKPDIVTRPSDSQLKQLNYNASRAGKMDYYSTGKYADQSQSDMARYSNQPKDRTVQSMKIIEGLNLSGNNPQQGENTNTSGGAVSTDSDSTTPLNKTVTNQGNDQVAGSLKIWSRGGGRTLDQADAQTESWLKSRGVDIDQISKHNKRSVYRDLRARGPHIVNGTIRLDGGRGNQNKYNLKINQS